MIDGRQMVMETLTELLHWDARKAIAFLDAISEHECSDLMQHVSGSSQPIVGVAAVVYRVRLRQAGSDESARKRAAVEANEHYKLFGLQLGGHVNAVPDPQPKPVHRVAVRIGGRRREDDTR